VVGLSVDAHGSAARDTTSERSSGAGPVGVVAGGIEGPTVAGELSAPSPVLAASPLRDDLVADGRVATLVHRD
jgi:hypothetical protein